MDAKPKRLFPLILVRVAQTYSLRGGLRAVHLLTHRRYQDLIFIVASSLLLLSCSISPHRGFAAEPKPRVELELITERGLAIGGAQEWLRAMKGLPVSSLRIRAAQIGERPEVTNRGGKNNPVYHVLGVITAQNTLLLPGGKFRMQDKRRIEDWIDKLIAGGEKGLTAKVQAYGLTAEQLLSLYEKLTERVNLSTKDKPTAEVVRAIAGRLDVDVKISPFAQRAMRESGDISDQLQGFSSGTALAAILRPIDLSIKPQPARGGRVQLLVDLAGKEDEMWPVGWKPEKSPGKVAPGLFKFIPVEIEETPLSEALEVVGKRLDTPILIDYKTLDEKNIDLEKIKVSLPPGKKTYKRILDRLLFQARLKMFIRIDEAGKPFLWITALRR